MTTFQIDTGLPRPPELPARYSRLTFPERRQARLEYARRQGGKCAHCGTDLDADPAPHVKRRPLNLRLFPANFLKHPVHLHHGHKTDMTIGVVHAHCNGVLWQYHGE